MLIWNNSVVILSLVVLYNLLSIKFNDLFVWWTLNYEKSVYIEKKDYNLSFQRVEH